MNRFLATTAALALCSTWLVTTAAADDTTAAAAPRPTLKVAIDQQLHDAQVLRMQGKFADAGKALGQIMLVAPDDARVIGEYGKTLAQQGRSQEAVSFLTRAIQMKSNDWTFYSALGVAYDQLDKRTQAREAYDRALALKPGEPSVLNNYAVSRMLAGDYAGAQKMLLQVQASGTNDPKVAGNLAKLAQLEGNKAPVATAAAAPVKPRANTAVAAQATHAPVAVATLAPPKVQGGVMMQAVPVDPHAGPVGHEAPQHAPAVVATAPKPQSAPPAAATHAPTALASRKAPDVKTPAPVAVASTAPNSAHVLMQKVPVDPLAGPVAPRTAAEKPKALASARPHTAAPAKAVTASANPAENKHAPVLAKTAPPKLSAPPALRTASEPD